MPDNFTPPDTLEECEWLLAELKPQIEDISIQIQRFHEGAGPLRDNLWIKRAIRARRHKTYQMIKTKRRIRSLTTSKRVEAELANLRTKLKTNRQTADILATQLRHCKSLVRAYAADRVEQMYADLNELQAAKRAEHSSAEPPAHKVA